LDRAVLETASDRYVIVEYLAEGGMGAIYLGKKLGVDGFEKEVVLKQLLPEFTREPKFIDLFLREARLSAALDHANIVRTVDLVNAGDDYFMVMEYVRGGDLRTLMRRARRRHRTFSPQAAVFIGHEILEALAYAHGKSAPDGRPLNLIHRDVSPSNILLSGAGEVKLTDFGIAKASTHRSVFYKVKGKVGYMSPEQARGEGVDRRADLFSLAVVMWEVLVGERLFVGDLLSTAAMVYSQKVRPPSSKRGDVPPELDAVILKALSLDPRQRFQSAEEMQEALSRAASRNRILAGASEMATQLRDVCGDDPSTWLKLEALAADESQSFSTHQPGTAVLSTTDDDDPFDDSEPHPARPQPVAALEHKELTSVIAVRGDGDDGDLGDEPATMPKLEAKESSASRRRTDSPEVGGPRPVTRRLPDVASSEAVPLTPLQPSRASDRLQMASAFDHEESHAATRVRSSASGNIEIEPRSRSRAPDREPAPSGRPSWEEPTRASQSSPVDDIAPTPAPGGSKPRARIPSSTGMVRSVAGRQIPTSGVREFSTPNGRRAAPRRRRLLPIILLFLVIGVGVAIAVGFFGPELEVTDPSVQPIPQTQTPR
jgi:serine/threonine-protein kinase